jgi:hypothetical protein
LKGLEVENAELKQIIHQNRNNSRLLQNAEADEYSSRMKKAKKEETTLRNDLFQKDLRGMAIKNNELLA